MDVDVGFLKTQWDAFSSAPVPAMLFLAVGAIAAWWLKSAVDKGQIDALKERHGILEERARLMADKAQPTIEESIQTDDKGNVKPPTKASTLDTPAADMHSDPDEFDLFMKMQYAYLEEGDCLPKVTEYYGKLKSIGGLIHPQQLEAEYLLSQFRCGVSSAINALKIQSGPAPDSFFANAVLAHYYQSIGENHAAVQYSQYQFDHAPDRTRKFNSALRLAKFLTDADKWEDGISFLKNQMSYFQLPNEHAALWEAIGELYGLRGLNWRKHLCFEKSLNLNPDNTELRFALAYSYGEKVLWKAMAAHHYEILLEQTPLNSTASNNLSVIYDEVGAVGRKISLLRNTQRRKDNAYVSANLATAYAKAGFLRNARDCLEQVSVGEQQVNIVQAAYRTIKDRSEGDRQIVTKLDSVAKLNRDLIETRALAALNETDEELLARFIGEWQLGGSTIVRISKEDGKLAGTISTENSFYEHTQYKVTAEYEPGLLQLNAQLEEASLRERLAANELLGGHPGLGLRGSNSLAASSLLQGAFNRPDERFKLMLVPGEPDVLYGLKTISYSTSGGKSEEEPRAMLNATEVHLRKRVP